ncbi:SAGA-associated factor 29-like [Hydractinia symbiolongicarpus]|uniref:SAGA-associated factor 29-like n=1 Tax=Hydractinia symbiolongicarpus TaxID=13093 RepID=UPI002551AD52|nr:SAGA-associated factor 29-like [Hydractinia symbiolongicarpus]
MLKNASGNTFVGGSSGQAVVVTDALKELHQMIYNIQEERNRSADNLSNINKTHEKMRHETRVSAYFKSKLKSLYKTAIADAKTESELIQKAMEKILEIKRARNERRGSGSNLSSLGKHSYQDEPRKGMRRGVLMSMLQQNAVHLPIWNGRAGETPAPLCGAMPADSSYICRPGDHVAARVKYPEEEEQYILAEVVSYNASLGKYEVEDIDYSEEEGKNEKERHNLSRRRIIPLPLYKVDPQQNPEGLFQMKQLVLALYPQTTCFYKAVVHSVPKTKDMDYVVLFEDTSYADGYSPPLNVPQRYIVAPRKR